MIRRALGCPLICVVRALAWADNRTLVGDPHPTLFDPEGDTPA